MILNLPKVTSTSLPDLKHAIRSKGYCEPLILIMHFAALRMVRDCFQCLVQSYMVQMGFPLVHAIFTALTISIMLSHSAWEADLRIGNPCEVF